MGVGLNLRLSINNTNVKYLPNTLKVKRGYGEIKSEVIAFGENDIDQVDTIDLTTKVGGVSFDLKTTKEAIELLDGRKTNFNNNAIELSNESGSITINLRQAKVMNEPDIETGAEGKFTVEFDALPTV